MLNDNPFNFLCFKFPKVFMRFTKCKNKNPAEIWCKYSHQCETNKTFFESDIDKFIDVNVSFEQNQKVALRDIYEKYLDYYGFDENSIIHGKALSHIKFTAYITKRYKHCVHRQMGREQGYPPMMFFVGMRLITTAEALAENTENQKEKICELLNEIGDSGINYCTIPHLDQSGECKKCPAYNKSSITALADEIVKLQNRVKTLEIKLEAQHGV